MKAIDQFRGLVAWYRAFKTTRRILAVMSVAVLAAACGGSSDDATGPGTSNKARLRIENRSEHSAWYVYTRACGTSTWSGDQLGSHIIQINHAVTFNVDPGCRDIMAETSFEFGGQQMWPAVNLAASQTDTLRLDEWQYTP